MLNFCLLTRGGKFQKLQACIIASQCTRVSQSNCSLYRTYIIIMCNSGSKKTVVNSGKHVAKVQLSLVICFSEQTCTSKVMRLDPILAVELLSRWTRNCM